MGDEQQKEHEIIELHLGRIKVDPSIQSRTKTHPGYVQEFGEAMLRGDVFPPVVVFFDGKIYWLADGFHRHAGAAMVGIAKLRAEVREGSRRDAAVHSAGANIKFSIPRSPDDMKRAIFLLLEDPEWMKKADAAIARHCGVAHSTVRKNRVTFCNERNVPIPAFVENESGTVYKTNRDGKPRIYPRTQNGKTRYQASVGGKTVYLGSDRTDAEAKLKNLAETIPAKVESESSLTSVGLKDYLARSGLSFEASGFHREYPGVTGISGHSCRCTIAGDDPGEMVTAVGCITILFLLSKNDDDRFVILCRKTTYQKKICALVDGFLDVIECLTPDELIASIREDGAKKRAP